ncbi:MAG: sigma-70 family RNA polymerase sigma factor [Pseudonocardiales bacterium]
MATPEIRSIGSVTYRGPGGADERAGPDIDQMDADTAYWLRSLTASGRERDTALVRLHALLLRIARSEARRRSPQFGVTGPELDDLAHQAAADALLAITTKLGQFRGDSRFTTWAYKFVVFEVGAKINRHHWQRPGVAMDGQAWERLPARFGMQPEAQLDWRDLVAGVRQAVEQELTERQRRVFVAIMVGGMPLDVLAAQIGANRNAVYKTMFDARRKIRAALVADGLIKESTSDQTWGRAT